jgi:hypothetical protein
VQTVRSRLTGPAVAGVAVLLAGCALPEGVDGDLTGAWGVMPDPMVFVPEPETCHFQQSTDFQDTVTLGAYRPVDCDDGFRVETVHVGSFSGEAAERVTPPPYGSPELQEAYRECDEAAADYLGADFRHGRLWLGVAKPSSLAWDGGARWFRCDAGVWLDHDSIGDTLMRHVGSLRGALADDDSELALGCFYPTISDEDGLVDTMNPVDCDEPHTAEFVGVWTAPDATYPDVDLTDGENRIHRGCRSAVADYVGVPDDADLRFRTGTIAWLMSEWDWDAGDRGVQCYLWLGDREVSESLAGAGTRGLPVS